LKEPVYYYITHDYSIYCTFFTRRLSY